MKVSGPLNLAGLEYVANLTALNALTDLFEGRIVNVNGTVYIYSGSAWSALAAGAASVPNITAPTAGQILRSSGSVAAWDPQYPAGSAGKFLQTDGSGGVSWQDPPATIPAQSGNAAKYLTTDGTNASWSAILRAGVAAGTPNHVLINNGSGVWTSEAALAASRGGLGTDASSFTGFVKAASGVFSAAAIGTSDLPSGIPATKIGTGTVDDTELGYLDGVTSSIQTQLTAKLPKAGGTMTGVLTLSADPSSALDAATKQYVDNLLSGVKVKDSVACATTGNIALTGTQTIDGIAVAVTVPVTRVLVRAQTNPADNGIYLVSAGAWGRATDANSWTKLTGAFTFVEDGTVYGDVGFVCTINAGGIIGTNPVTWVQFSGAGTYTAGSGLSITGTTFAAKVDTTSITTDGSSQLKVSDTVPLVTPSITQYAELTGISSPAVPAAGKVRLFAGTDGKIYKYANGDAAASIVGGGLTTQLKITTFTAAPNFAYLCDTSSGGYTATLPAGASGSVIRFTDDKRTWASGNLIIAPATGETIGGLSANDTLVCDLSGAFVQLSWDASRWVVETNGYVASVSTGTLSTATGMGAKNYLTDTASNWVPNNNSLILVGTETLASLVPAGYTKTSALRITNNGGGSYARARFTLDKADYGKKFQLSFDQSYAGTAGDYTLQVWSNTASDYTGTATQLTLQTSSISALTGSFITTLDLSNATAPYIEVRVLGVSGSTPLYLNNLYIGPGVQVQGAAVGDVTLTASVIGATNSSAYTNTLITNCVGVRVGSFLEVTGKLSFTGLPGTGTGALVVRVSTSGMTIDSTKSQNWAGSGVFYDSSTANTYNLSPVPYMTSSNIDLQFAVTGESVSAVTLNPASAPVAFASGDLLTFSSRIPIAEWAGGTVNLGAGAQVQIYSSTTGVWDQAAAAGNTVAGLSPITGLLGANRSKVVRLPYAPQSISDVKIVFQPTGYTAPVGQEGWRPLIVTSGINYGAQIVALSGTDVTVTFYQYAGFSTAANFGASGVNWGSGDGAWGLVVANPSSPVGFGLAGTDGSAGLYKAGQAPGSTTGAAIAAGNIGEYKSSEDSVFTNDAASGYYYTGKSIPLTLGTWQLWGYVSETKNGATVNNTVAALISTNSNNDSTGNIAPGNHGFTFAWTDATIAVPSRVVTVSSTTTYYLKGYNGATVGTPQHIAGIFAVRIA